MGDFTDGYFQDKNGIYLWENGTEYVIIIYLFLN